MKNKKRRRGFGWDNIPLSRLCWQSDTDQRENDERFFMLELRVNRGVVAMRKLKSSLWIAEVLKSGFSLANLGARSGYQSERSRSMFARLYRFLTVSRRKVFYRIPTDLTIQTFFGISTESAGPDKMSDINILQALWRERIRGTFENS